MLWPYGSYHFMKHHRCYWIQKVVYDKMAQVYFVIEVFTKYKVCFPTNLIEKVTGWKKQLHFTTSLQSIEKKPLQLQKWLCRSGWRLLFVALCENM